MYIYIYIGYFCCGFYLKGIRSCLRLGAPRGIVQCFTGPYMGRPKWVEIIKHLKPNRKSLKTLHFVSGPHEITKM